MQLALDNPNSIGSWYLITENCDASLKIHPGLIIGHDDAHQFSLEPAHEILTLDICVNGNLHLQILGPSHQLQTKSGAIVEKVVVEPGTPVQLNFFDHQILFDTDLVYVEDRTALELALVDSHASQPFTFDLLPEPESSALEQEQEQEAEPEPESPALEHAPITETPAQEQDSDPGPIALEQPSGPDTDSAMDLEAESPTTEPRQAIIVPEASKPDTSAEAAEAKHSVHSGNPRWGAAAAVCALIAVILFIALGRNEPQSDKPIEQQPLLEPVDETLQKANPGTASDPEQAPRDLTSAITAIPADTSIAVDADAANPPEEFEQREAIETTEAPTPDPTAIAPPAESSAQAATDTNDRPETPAQDEATADAARVIEQPADDVETDDKVEAADQVRADDSALEETVDEEAASRMQPNEVPVVDLSTPLVPPAAANATEATATAEPPPAEAPAVESTTDVVPPSDDAAGPTPPPAETGEIELALTELTVVSKTPPAFPRVGTRNSLSVDAEFVVDTSGNVRDLEIKGDPPQRFKRSVVEAVQTWQFEPYLEAGTPRPVRTFVRITFRN